MEARIPAALSVGGILAERKISRTIDQDEMGLFTELQSAYPIVPSYGGYLFPDVYSLILQ